MSAGVRSPLWFVGISLPVVVAGSELSKSGSAIGGTFGLLLSQPAYGGAMGIERSNPAVGGHRGSLQ